MRYRHNLLVHIFFAIALAVFLKNSTQSQAAGPERVVAVPVANMYSATTEDSDVVSQAIIGSNVVTLEVAAIGQECVLLTSTRAGCWVTLFESWANPAPTAGQD